MSAGGWVIRRLTPGARPLMFCAHPLPHAQPFSVHASVRVGFGIAVFYGRRAWHLYRPVQS